MEAMIVQTTFGEKEEALALARLLLEQRLIACAQVVAGALSLYWWQGKIEQDNELILLMKTTADRYPELEKVILAEHPYETPEVLALPVSRGSRAYLDWLAGEVR